MTPRTYSLLLIACLSLALAGVALFNYAVDPYGIFDTPTHEGFNRSKPEAGSQIRLVKAYALRNHDHQGLILGNSKALRSLDPSHPLLAQERYYNASLTGADIEELWHYLVHANHRNSIKQVILFLEPNSRGGPKPDFSRERLQGETFDEVQGLIDYRNALLTSSALKASIKTIREQASPHEELTDKGMLVLNRARPDSLRLFRKIEKSVFASHIQAPFDSSTGKTPPEETYLHYLTRILEYCHARDIQLTMLFPPMHARLQETHRLAGKWNFIEEWKRTVLRLNESVATSPDEAFPVWDFSLLTPMSTEKITGDATSEWHFDASHFRPNYGELMLSAIFSEPPSGVVDGVELGARVDSASVNVVLEKINRQHEQWRHQNPDQVEELAIMARAHGFR